MSTLFLNRRKLMTGCLTTGLLGAVSVPAYAHRQKKAQTSIEWNPSSKSLEITHILHRHDAEKAMAAMGKIDKPDLSSLKARALLALHIAEQFSLSDLSQNPVKFEIIGAENEGSNIYAYFEAKLETPPAGLLISNSIFHDVYADQINHVNVQIGDEIKSAIFARGDKPKKVLA